MWKVPARRPIKNGHLEPTVMFTWALSPNLKTLFSETLLHTGNGIWKLSSTPVVNLQGGRPREYQDMSFGGINMWYPRAFIFFWKWLFCKARKLTGAVVVGFLEKVLCCYHWQNVLQKLDEARRTYNTEGQRTLGKGKCVGKEPLCLLSKICFCFAVVTA